MGPTGSWTRAGGGMTYIRDGAAEGRLRACALCAEQAIHDERLFCEGACSKRCWLYRLRWRDGQRGWRRKGCHVVGQERARQLGGRGDGVEGG